MNDYTRENFLLNAFTAASATCTSLGTVLPLTPTAPTTLPSMTRGIPPPNISGKWKITIIYYLSVNGKLRFSEIKKLFPKISHKVLTAQIRELEEDGIVHREVFPEVPLRVEYSLTELGKSLMPILLMMYDWGKKNIHSFKEDKPS